MLYCQKKTSRLYRDVFLTALAAVVEMSGMEIMAVVRVFVHQMTGGDDGNGGNNQNFFHFFLLKIIRQVYSVFMAAQTESAIIAQNIRAGFPARKI